MVLLGDLVTSGDVIAIQDSAKIELLQLKKMRAKLLESELRLADSEAELQAEIEHMFMRHKSGIIGR